MINLLYTVEKIGPYHNARFNSLSKTKGINLNVLETNSLSNRYPWEENFNQSYKVFKLSNTNIKNLKIQTKKELQKILKESSPDIIYITGWNENVSHYLLFICQFRKIPIVILSDSRYKDSKRTIFFELIKKFLLKGCTSAIVAGRESENYLIQLGFKKENIFKPYNVVDNKYFLNKNNSKKLNNYILCISRFIKRKNHIKLLKAFELYKQQGGYLNLKLIGSGSEKKNIIHAKDKLSFASNISIETWKDISELKEYYSNAKVFVLLSTNDQWGLVINEAMASSLPCIVSYECGCYVELIKDKNTGWGVDPGNKNQLTNILHEIDQTGEKEFLEKKSNCLKIINNYSLENFSQAVQESASFSLKNSKFSPLCLITSYLMFLFK